MIQEQFISRLLQSRDSSLITLNNIGSDYLSDYSAEYTFICNHLHSYNTIPDKETFLNVFPDFPLIDVQEPDSYLLEQLLRDKNKRFLVKSYNEAGRLLTQDDVEGAMSLLKKASDLSNTYISLNAVDITKDTSRLEHYEERIDNAGKYYLTTGFPELDAIMGGGFDRRDELATISARPGVGKSFITFKCAAAAAMQGLRVGIYSGEMSEDKVAYRIDTLISGISNGGLMHGAASIKDSYENYIEKLRNNTNIGPIYILTPQMINGAATVSALQAFIEKYDLEALYIDQYSLLEDQQKAKNPVEQFSNIAKDLKMLQVLKRIPIIAISQQNRASTENGASTEHLAQSDRIGQNSTFVLFLDKKDDILNMRIAKARDGGGDGQLLSYKINFNMGTFMYLPKEGDEKRFSNNSSSDESESTYSLKDYSLDEVF